MWSDSSESSARFGETLGRGPRGLRECSCLSYDGRVGGRDFAEVEGALLVSLLSANLLMGGLTTRFDRVEAAGFEERGVDELDGFPRSVRPARVPALPDKDADLGFRLLSMDSSSVSRSTGVSRPSESARRVRVVELPGLAELGSLRSMTMSQDWVELDAFGSLPPLADRARRSAMQLVPVLCFLLALPVVSVALIMDSSATACLNFEFPRIASATIFLARTFSVMS